MVIAIEKKRNQGKGNKKHMVGYSTTHEMPHRLTPTYI